MKEILLSRGKVALVDDFDYDELSKYKWCAWTPNKGRTFYAMRSIWGRNGEKKKAVYMHRQIMAASGFDVKIDHVDHDGLNNRKSNLRISSQSQNMANVKRRRYAGSSFFGVVKSRNGKKWIARIFKDYKNNYLGTFETEVEAALAYNANVVKFHGEFARLNKIGGDVLLKNKALQ